MGSMSIWHWLIVLLVVLVLFGGRGKISQLMGDVGKGLKAFKRSMKEDDQPEDASFTVEQPRLKSDQPAGTGSGEASRTEERATRS